MAEEEINARAIDNLDTSTIDDLGSKEILDPTDKIPVRAADGVDYKVAGAAIDNRINNALANYQKSLILV